jgi:aspartate aminotransferase-like enzyme
LKKRILFTPGPTQTPLWLRRKIEEFTLHHRDEEYPQVISEVKRDLQELFGAPSAKILIFRGGGTSMMEAVLVNFLKPSDPVLVINVGFFGDRWEEIAQEEYGLTVHSCRSKWGYSFEYSSLIPILQKNEVQFALSQVTDTSTGVKVSFNFGHIVKCYHPDALIATDAVLEGGVSPIKMEREGIDILIGASQKAFMLPPGMGFIILGPRALDWLNNISKGFPSYFYNFRRALEKEDNGGILTTPPTEHIAGLHIVLNHILREKGEAAWYDEHRIRAELIRDRLGKIGFKLFTKHTPSNGLSVLTPPPGFTPTDIIKKLAERGFRIEQGLGQNKNLVIRIAHFAGTDEAEILKLIENIEEIVSSS